MAKLVPENPMQTIQEPSRQTPVIGHFDICVVGGSCTGVFAAVAAARLGAKVALIENNGFFGGVATAGLVNIWHSFFDTGVQRQIIGGLTGEIVQRLKGRKAVEILEPTGHSYVALNTAELIIELDEMVREHRIQPFLHSRFVQTVGRYGHLQAVIVEDKTGRRALAASCFVDATGDGDVIARMGLPTDRGATLQPPTTCMLLRGLAELRRRNPDFDLGRAVHDPSHPNALKQGFLWHAQVVGAPELTMVAGTRVAGADCSDADQLTATEIEGRRQIRAMCDILRHLPGGQETALVSLPAYVGVRQTRQARCLHELTEQEVLTGLRFDDAIANGSYRVDIHHIDRAGITLRYLDGREEYAAPGQDSQWSRWRQEQAVDPTFYQIPYRCLVPQGSQNVLVAGRLIDADAGAYGAVRVMVNCNQTGQAAGVAAALALEEACDVSRVNATRLREVLASQGAIVI